MILGVMVVQLLSFILSAVSASRRFNYGIIWRHGGSIAVLQSLGGLGG
jgi:hypothetical protein